MNADQPTAAPMNAMAIAMVKNEADIIEAMVRHNLAFVDLMVLIDNASSDGTREILRALQHEGLPLLIVDDPEFGYFQSEKMTQVYRQVAPIFQPELVYLLDADEFLLAPGRAALEGALASLPLGSTALLPWRTHVPAPGVAPDPQQLLTDPLGALPHRRRTEAPTYFKAVIRRNPADDCRLTIEQGNHQIHLDEAVQVPTVTLDGAALIHLPVRSVEQLNAKVVNGWHAYRVKNQHRPQPGAGFQWQQLYERIVHGEGLSAETLCETALAYAQAPGRHDPATDLVLDPAPARYGELKYLGLARTSALAKVALAWSAGEPTGTPPLTGDGRALDLAPALDLLEARQARSALLVAGEDRWALALAQAVPNLPVQDALHAGQSHQADLLLAPELPHEVCLALAPLVSPTRVGAIVWWPDQPRTAETLDTELNAWLASGWLPDLMGTMSYRALASYAAERQGAIVLTPIGSVRPERAATVQQLLVTLAAQPSTWQDPAPEWVSHPLQTLHLSTPTARGPAAQPAPPAAAVQAPATPRSVLICGSGRSGTSCLAGMFGPETHQHASNLYAPSPSNPKGYFENHEINFLNEEILTYSSLTQFGADTTRALLQGFAPGQLWLARWPDNLATNWTDDQQRRIRALVARQPFCLKDPRFSMTAAAWLAQAPDTLVLGVYRPPAVTAESLLRECRSAADLRDFRISVNDCFTVWRQMYRRLVMLYRGGADVVFLRYQDLFDADRLTQLEARVRAPLRRQFAETRLNRTRPDLNADAECLALEALLDQLSERTFLRDRAGDQRLIDAFLAAWPARTLDSAAASAEGRLAA